MVTVQVNIEAIVFLLKCIEKISEETRMKNNGDVF